MRYVRRYCYCCETYKQIEIDDEVYFKLKSYGLVFGFANSKVYTICGKCWNKIVGGEENE